MRQWPNYIYPRSDPGSKHKIDFERAPNGVQVSRKKRFTRSTSYLGTIYSSGTTDVVAARQMINHPREDDNWRGF